MYGKEFIANSKMLGIYDALCRSWQCTQDRKIEVD